MNISFEIPKDIEQEIGSNGADLNRDAKEVYLMEQYRQAKITHRQLQEALGLILLCQLGRYPLWHAHEFTQQQLLGRFEPEPVADLAMYLRQ